MASRCGSILVLLQVCVQARSFVTSALRRTYNTCPVAMRSVNYKPDASLYLESETPMPSVQEGDVLIKVLGERGYKCGSQKGSVFLMSFALFG